MRLILVYRVLFVSFIFVFILHEVDEIERVHCTAILYTYRLHGDLSYADIDYFSSN